MNTFFRLFLFIAFMASFLCTHTANAQVGNTGAPLGDVDLIPVCWNVNDVDSMLFLGVVTIVGQPDVVDTIGYIGADGAMVQVSEGTTTVGYCAGSGGELENEYFEVEVCDNAGNKYVRIFQVNPDGSISVIATINEEGSTGITINQPLEFEWCNVNAYETPTISRFTVTTTSQIFPVVGDGLGSIEILNVGHTIATLDIDGNEEELLPGERFICHTNYDHVEQTQRMCGRSYTITANGGKVRVVQRFED